MIRIDSRIGSGELEKLFLPFGIKVAKVTLEFGDFAFEGNGPDGVRYSIGFERKRIGDLQQSIESRRLSGHQLPGIATNYDYCYLMVEGIWRPNKDGLLEVMEGDAWVRTGFAYRALDNYLSSMELKAGMIYRRTTSPYETVCQIVDAYRWWTDKDWEEHGAHEAVYAPVQAPSRKISFIPREIKLAEKVAMQLPGLDTKARYVAAHFKSMGELAQAPVEEWAKVVWKTRKGMPRRLGLASARKIVDAIWREGE